VCRFRDKVHAQPRPQPACHGLDVSSVGLQDMESQKDARVNAHAEWQRKGITVRAKDERKDGGNQRCNKSIEDIRAKKGRSIRCVVIEQKRGLEESRTNRKRET
jgi:hypothetical protein